MSVVLLAAMLAVGCDGLSTKKEPVVEQPEPVKVYKSDSDGGLFTRERSGVAPETNEVGTFNTTVIVIWVAELKQCSMQVLLGSNKRVVVGRVDPELCIGKAKKAR